MRFQAIHIKSGKIASFDYDSLTEAMLHNPCFAEWERVSDGEFVK